MRLAKRAMAPAVVAAAACWMLPSPAFAVTGPPDIKVTAKPLSQYSIDNPPRGDSAGDKFGFTEKLMQHGSRVGRDAVECTVERATRRKETLQCVGTLTFKGRGQITVQGAVTFTPTGPDQFSLAVTGGTGEFRGAGGEMVVDSRSGPDRYKIYFA